VIYRRCREGFGRNVVAPRLDVGVAGNEEVANDARAANPSAATVSLSLSLSLFFSSGILLAIFFPYLPSLRGTFPPRVRLESREIITRYLERRPRWRGIFLSRSTAVGFLRVRDDDDDDDGGGNCNQ